MMEESAHHVQLHEHERRTSITQDFRGSQPVLGTLIIKSRYCAKWWNSTHNKETIDCLLKLKVILTIRHVDKSYWNWWTLNFQFSCSSTKITSTDYSWGKEVAWGNFFIFSAFINIIRQFVLLRLCCSMWNIFSIRQHDFFLLLLTKTFYYIRVWV